MSYIITLLPIRLIIDEFALIWNQKATSKKFVLLNANSLNYTFIYGDKTCRCGVFLIDVGTSRACALFFIRSSTTTLYVVWQSVVIINWFIKYEYIIMGLRQLCCKLVDRYIPLYIYIYLFFVTYNGNNYYFTEL